MPFHQPDSIRYFTFDSLTEAGAVHAAFTRCGGLSPEPWASLNVGGTVGDEGGRVRQNRQRSFQALGLPFESLYDVWQVHSKDVVRAVAPRPSETKHLQADAILTDRPGVSLFMRFADCVPILLYDPYKKIIGLVHAGWKGTVLKVAAQAVRDMQAGYGSKAENILAGIGPSIGPDHYAVGEEVILPARRAFGSDVSGLLQSGGEGNPESGVKFDLWSANCLVLESAGVRKVEIAEICTACHTEDWYSHRGEKGRTGRFGALIALA